MKRSDRRSRTAILVVAIVIALLLGSDRHSNRAFSAESNATIYVTDFCSGAVTAYPADANGDVAPLPPAPSGISFPQSIALDQNGRIYVANGCNDLSTNEVVIYAKGSNGNVAPIATIGGSNTGLEEVTAVALDSNDNIYVSGASATRGVVAIFALLGNSTGLLNEAPLATIGGILTGFEDPEDIVLDAADHIFVVDDFQNSVSVFSPLGSGRGNLNEAPFATLSGSNTGLAEPQSMALDGAGNVYIPNPSSESLMVYAPLANQTGAVNAAPFATLNGNLTGLLDPRGIALDSNDKIFVGEHTQILVFPALGASTGTLNEAPLATISGSNTDLGLATGITLDSNNNLFVTDEARSSVFMYSALGSSTGTLNEAPSALISTTATTGLGEAEGIALDSTGKIYVASFGNFPNVVPGSSNLAGLYVYPAGSNANSAPLAEISGAATGLSIPEGIAIDSQNKIYVADLNAQVLVYPALGSNSGLRNEAPIATITEVQRLVRSMRIAMPWLEDSDGPACRAWAQMEILADTAFAVLQQLFIVGKNGEPRRLLTDFGQLRQARLAYERVLGMTPAARVAIQANGSRAPVDLAAAFARAEDAEVVGGSTEGDE